MIEHSLTVTNKIEKNNKNKKKGKMSLLLS